MEETTMDSRTRKKERPRESVSSNYMLLVRV